MQHPQMGLFEHVGTAYASASGHRLSNDELYRTVAARAGIDAEDLNVRVPIGQDGQKHNLVKRRLRWQQQTMKSMGLIERVPNERGIWQLTDEGKSKLTRIKPSVAMLAYSTDLGIAVWGHCERVFQNLDTPIMLCVTSPPYPLSHERRYGNPTEAEYVDFITRALEPIVKHLAPEGSIALNISNDIFLHKSPARSLYREKLVLALCERLGLFKMDTLIWHNPSKPPGPVRYASIERNQLNVSYEPIYWFSPDPARCKADNRRVLEPHTEKHLKLLERGGESRARINADGAYRVREGSYGNYTEGRIPRNIITRGHACKDQQQLRKTLKELGLPVHGAPMPLSLVTFLIKFLTDVNDLVVDPFGGSGTSVKGAETLGRRWMSAECMWEYVRGSAERFRQSAGFIMHPGFMM